MHEHRSCLLLSKYWAMCVRISGRSRGDNEEACEVEVDAMLLCLLLALLLNVNGRGWLRGRSENVDRGGMSEE